MKRPPTDFEVIREIYRRHEADFVSASARGQRAADISVPIDIPGIAAALGVDEHIVFGRLYYHLDPKYAPPNEPDTARKFLFTQQAGPDANCVNFPLLDAVFASLWQNRRRDQLALATAVVSFAIALASLIVSVALS